MASRTLDSVLQHIRRLIAGPTAAASTDRQLLVQFVQQHDQSAFAELLRRHAPMVLGVCRQLLADPNDVDDAFQATFLVLVRRAAAISWRESVGGWLHGVARRTALNAKAGAGRRHGNLPGPEATSQVDPMADVNRRELCQALHEELRRLPAKYRDPVILCCLEGKTHEEAALELGWPKGSMAKRIAAGQERLRQRLTARGLAVSAALLSTVMAEEAAAVVSPTLLDNTLKAAALVAAGTSATGAFSASVATLAQGVIKTMWMTRIMKLTAATFVVLSVAGLGGGWLYHNGAVAVPVVDKEPEPPAKPRTDPPGVPLELRLTANKDTYMLDLGGKTAAEFRKHIEALNKEGNVQALATAAVDLALEPRNTGDKPLSVTFADEEWRTIGMHLDLTGPGVFNISPRVLQNASRELKPVTIELAPGKGNTFRIASLGSWPQVYPYTYWTQPGEYALTVSWSLAVAPAPKGAMPAGPTAGLVTLKSNQVKLKVNGPAVEK